eukprot:SM000106S13934  [mRNA]  locus=s106:80853:83893:+ [translate_table: standard]
MAAATPNGVGQWPPGLDGHSPPALANGLGPHYGGHSPPALANGLGPHYGSNGSVAPMAMDYDGGGDDVAMGMEESVASNVNGGYFGPPPHQQQPGHMLPAGGANSSQTGNQLPVASAHGAAASQPPQRARYVGDDALVEQLRREDLTTEMPAGMESWMFDLDRLELGNLLATGSFGRVYHGAYKGTEVAVKMLHRNTDNPYEIRIQDDLFIKEVQVHATLDHENIVRFAGACRRPPTLWCIVTEYCEGGSVYNYLNERQQRGIPLNHAVSMALDIASGMAYLHSRFPVVMHRDLKSHNLLISNTSPVPRVKIADFGVARIELLPPEDMTPETGTYRWMAPEAAYNVVNHSVRPRIPAHCPPSLRGLMEQCWDNNPQVRPEFNDIITRLSNVQQELWTRRGVARFRSRSSGSSALCCFAAPQAQQ